MAVCNKDECEGEREVVLCECVSCCWCWGYHCSMGLFHMGI